MIRGAQKKMIVVKTGDSALFEEAYFMVRAGVERAESDMVLEANRIIEECAPRRTRRKRGDFFLLILPLLCFIAGSLIGGGIALAAVMV